MLASDPDLLSADDPSRLIIPARQLRSRASLARILEAAEDVLRNEGLDSFSIGRVAQASGVSVGGIYRRVKGKSELLQVIKDAAMRRIAVALAAAFDRRFTSFEPLVQAFVGALVATIPQDEQLHQILFSSGDADPAISAVGDQARNRMLETFVVTALPLFTHPSAAPSRAAAAITYDLIIGAGIRRVRFPQSPTGAQPWDEFAEQMVLMGSSYLAAADARIAAEMRR
jgi:AcrR family transcriptional regulator